MNLGNKYIKGGIYTRLDILDGFLNIVDINRENSYYIVVIKRRGGEERLNIKLESSSNSLINI